MPSSLGFGVSGKETRLPLAFRNFITKADFKPDTLVAYAMAKIRLSGRKLSADGAAFRSRGRWFNIKFGCAVSAMNSLHGLEIAELDDLLIGCKLREPFQRLPAAWIGEYRRRKELFCLNDRASIRRWGGCFHGRLRLWHWLRRRRCSL